MATFSLDAATEPTYLDIIDIAAGYGIFSTPMDGLFPGDLVQTMTLVVTDALTGDVAISKAIDIAQRADGYFEWVTSSEVDAHWTFTAAEIATLQSGTWMYSCSAMIYRSSQTYTREYQGGGMAVRPTVPLPPLLANAVEITGGPVVGDPGDTFQLAAVVTDAYGNVITGQTVIWTSSSAAIATVSQGGLVTLVTTGNAIITATCQGISATTTVSSSTTPVIATQGDILVYNATDELFEAAHPTVDHFLAGTFGGNGSSVYAFPGFVTVASGLTVSSGGITVSAGTTALQAVTATTVTATTFTGALVGNASTATTAGNAATATALQTARTINGVSFNGTANITIVAAADAGSLTGTTLAANVVTSSLTTLGVLASPHMTGAVVDSGGFTVTAGTTAVQALTATTGTFSSGMTAGWIGAQTGGAEGAIVAAVGSLRAQSDSSGGPELWQKRLGSDAYGWRPMLPLTPVADITTFWTFGDSITAGQGATSAAHDYVQIILSNLPSVATTTQYAVSGTGSYTAIANAYSIGSTATPRTTNLATWMAALNDLRRGGGAAKTIAKIQNCLRAWMAFMLSETSVAADNVAVTPTGSWTAFAPAGGVTRASVMSGNALSAVVGSTLSWTFTGDSLVIGTWVADGSAYVFGSASVTVDGVVQATFNANNGCDGIADSAYNNQRVPGAIVLRGLGSGSHTVVVTPLDTTFVVDYFSTLRRPGAASPIIVATPPRFNTAGYAISPANATDAIIAQGANAIAAVAYGFVDYPAALAWTSSEYDVTTGISVDNLHPNNIGHAAIARAFLDVARLVTNPTTFSSATVAGAVSVGAAPPTGAGVNIDAATFGNVGLYWQNATAQGFLGASTGTVYMGASSNHSLIVRTNATDRLILVAGGTQLYPTTTSFTTLGVTGNRWLNFFSDAGTITNAFSVGNGLTVVAGTTAIQALTATTGVFSSTVSATVFTGALTGNASTATALATARAINGVNFDGTAAITVTAAAGTLTGATLNATVTASSLTSVGVLASPHVTTLTVDSGGLTVTSGTAALQAMSATTGSFSSTLAVTGQMSQGGGTNVVYLGSDGTQLSWNRNPANGVMFNASAFGYILQRVTSLTNTADLLKLVVYDPTGTQVTASALVVNGLGAVTLGIGLTVTTGGVTVSAGTTAVQALTATTGNFSGTLTFATSVLSTTALATPGALSATQHSAFASTVSGAVVMGYGTTNDVALMNRAGTVVLGITANTTGVTMAGALAITGALSGATTGAFSGNVTVASITSGTWTGTAVAALYGGTGLTSYAVGDTLYASATTPTIAKLTIGSAGQFLWVSGGLPAWHTLVSSDVSDLATSTVTFTNKRITKRSGTTASSATPTINTDNVDYYSITALAAAITSFTTNLSGTPTVGQVLWITITDNGTARALTFGASFEASTIALPTTTAISTRMDMTFVWNDVTSKWRIVGLA